MKEVVRRSVADTESFLQARETRDQLNLGNVSTHYYAKQFGK